MINTIKKQLTPEEILEMPCFFCGDGESFIFYLKSINKGVCMNCLENEEVHQFIKLKEKAQK